MAGQGLEAECETVLSSIERRPTRIRRSVWWPAVGRLLDADRDEMMPMLTNGSIADLLTSDGDGDGKCDTLARTHRAAIQFSAACFLSDRVREEVDRLEHEELPRLQKLMADVLRSFARAPPGPQDARLTTVSDTYARTVTALQRTARLREIDQRLRVALEVPYKSFAHRQSGRAR